MKSSPENLEKSEDENLGIPQPEGNKGTQSTGGSQSSPLTLSHNSQQFSGENKNSQQFSGEKTFSSSQLSQLSPEQLSSIGMMRDVKGDYFHVTNTEDGGYHLTPVTQESIAATVAEVQRQAQQAQQQQAQQQTQPNPQDTLMTKISENAVDQFQVNIQAIVRKVALSPTDYIGFAYLQGTVKHLRAYIFQ